MNQQNTYIALGIGILLVIAAGWYWYSQRNNADNAATMCTADVMQCLDGSYVSRVAPSCQFAACPGSNTGNQEATVSAKLNQSVTGAGVTVTPLEVVQDSRCPQDVQCIQAGTVELRVRIQSESGEVTKIVKLNESITFGNAIVMLTAVSPATKAGTPIAPADYLFTFKINTSEFPFDVKG